MIGKVYLAEREIRDIVKYLLNIVVLKRREDLVEIYQALPENVRRLILTYTRELESEGKEKADQILSRELAKMFEEIYRDLKRIHEKYVIIPRV